MKNIVRLLGDKNVSLRHLNQLTYLVMTTGHFEYFSIGNKWRVSAFEYVKQRVVIPCLSMTYVIFDELNNISGFYMGLRNDDYLKESRQKEPSACRDDTVIQQFYSKKQDLERAITLTDYNLFFFAVRQDLHGLIHPQYGVKIADLLYNHVKNQAIKTKASSIAYLVWESHISAVRFYARHGGQVFMEADLTNTIVSDRLFLMKTEF